ncbi:MAG: hypothetical protein IPP13_22200 [Kouleothrix sp.]|nr:hypothetical protein [Kouleothrix sp.]
MSINKNLTIDNLDTPNPRADHDGPWAITPRAPRTTWDVELVRWLCGTGAAGLAWWLLPPAISGTALAIAAAYVLKRWVLTDRIGGIEVRTWRNDVRGRDIVAPLGQAAIEHARRPLPNVSSYSPTMQQLPARRGEVIEGQVVEQSQLSGSSVQALPPSEWLAWFDTRPHGLLASETGGGKSTTAKAVLGSRIACGELVFILDPHSSDWFGLPGIGGGEDWGAVWVGMQVVIQEYRRRLTERDAHMRRFGQELEPAHFPRITVLLDEANLACHKLDVTAKRGDHTPWERFVETLGSGARKVNISILMLAQSPNVEDIGLSGPMRQNFTRIALDAATTRLMTTREETDPQRKKEILAALQGVEYPATSVQRGRVVLLDRTGLDRYPAPHNPSHALWTEGYDRVEATQRRRSLTMPAQRATVAHSHPSATLHATASVPADFGAKVADPQVALRSATPVAPLSNAQRDELVRILRRRKNAQGKPLSQDFIRDQLTRAGLTIAQSRLIDLCQEVDGI